MAVGLRQLDLKYKVGLRPFNSFRIEGEATCFIVAHSMEDLQSIIKMVGQPHRDFYFLGAGSNLLIADSPIKKSVVKLGEEFNYIKRLDGETLEVGAATYLSIIINYALKRGLGGLENFIGIPASIGGLLLANASSFGKEISECIEEVEIIDRDAKPNTLKREDIIFRYRDSSLKKSIVTGMKLKLKKCGKVKNNLICYINKRLTTQDFTFPSAGCIFKNPPESSAAYLIEQCGLKGFTLGGACISMKHANFVLNRCGAQSQDVTYIMEVIKERVYKKFGILLEEEIVRWGI